MISRSSVRQADLGRHGLDLTAASALFTPAAPADTTPQSVVGTRIYADFDGMGQVGNLTETYEGTGLHWLNWGWISGDYAKAQVGSTGYDRGVVSGDSVAYNENGDPATITSGGGNFDLNTVWLTSAYRLGMEIHIQGYDDGVLKYDRTVTVDDADAAKFKLGMTGVDTITFSASGGTHDPSLAADLDGTFFAADHFVFGAEAGAVRGRVFNDLDGDGVMDKGEGGLAGRTVFVDANHNATLDSWEISATTNAKGQYQLNGVSFGDYDIRQVIPQGETQTTPIQPNNGYQAVDKAFSWVGINSKANLLTFDNRDDGQVQIDLSHTLKLYGEKYSTIYVSTNGLISLSSDFASTPGNLTLPDDNNPHGKIAAFWDDLNLGSTGNVFFLDDTEHRRFVVEWKDVALFSDPSKLQTFEVILNYNGTITFQYKDMTDGGTGATIGIDSKDGSIGLQYSYDQDAVHSGQAIGFVPGTQPIADHVTVDSGQTTSHVDFGVQAIAAAQAGELVV